MKIFVDAYLLNKEFQGTKTYITNLYQNLSQLHHTIDITFGVTNASELYEEWQHFSNITLYQYKTANRWIRMWKEIPQYLQDNAFDFAHFQYIIPFRKANNCKYIVTIHDVLFLDFPAEFPIFYRVSRKILFGYSAKKSDVLLTVSSYSKERIATHFCLKKSAIQITPNGVSKKYFEDYNKDESKAFILKHYGIDKKIILYVSRIEPRKNQQLLVRFFDDLHQQSKDFSLVFIGKKSLDNKKLNNALQQIQEQTRENIYFIEQVSDNDLLTFYQASSYFIYPSFSEGFGIPPLEAAALQIPVLCSNQTAMQDFSFFEPFFENPNSIEFKTKFSQIVDFESKTLQKISKTIQQKYNWKSIAEDFYEILIEKF